MRIRRILPLFTAFASLGSITTFAGTIQAGNSQVTFLTGNVLINDLIG